MFRPRELPRLALEVLQSADGPLLINDIAIRVLALKGVALPGPTLQNKMRHQLRGILISFDRRGITSGVGRGLETLRVLAIGDAASLKLTSDS